MVKYEKFFKIEHLKNSTYNYTVKRKNFSGKYELVANVRIIPTERAEIHYIKNLKHSEQDYIENYFDDLVALWIKPQTDDIGDYIVYHRDSCNHFKKVCLLKKESSGHKIFNATHNLKSHEILFILNFMRNINRTN